MLFIYVKPDAADGREIRLYDDNLEEITGWSTLEITPDFEAVVHLDGEVRAFDEFETNYLEDGDAWPDEETTSVDWNYRSAFHWPIRPVVTRPSLWQPYMQELLDESLQRNILNSIRKSWDETEEAADAYADKVNRELDEENKKKADLWLPQAGRSLSVAMVNSTFGGPDPETSQPLHGIRVPLPKHERTVKWRNRSWMYQRNYTTHERGEYVELFTSKDIPYKFMADDAFKYFPGRAPVTYFQDVLKFHSVTVEGYTWVPTRNIGSSEVFYRLVT